MNSNIIIYGTPICAMVPPVRNLLERAAAPYDYIDISRDSEARAEVRAINEGYESVPTLHFPDGSTLTEPSLTQLETKLEALGYQVRPATWWERLRLLLDSPTTRLFGIIFVALGWATDNQTFLIFGVVFLAMGVVLRLVKGL